MVKGISSRSLSVMALYRIGDRHPNYKDLYFRGGDLKGLPVYLPDGHAVGTVFDLLVGEDERIQQLALDTGSKTVLVPAARCAKSKKGDCIYLSSMDRNALSDLPSYEEGKMTDESLSGNRLSYEREYQEFSLKQPGSAELFTPPQENLINTDSGNLSLHPQSKAEQEKAPEFQPISSLDRPIQLYEERLVTQKQRIKTGEVKISKRTVTESNRENIPITREKVIIEIESIYGGETRVDFGDAEVAEDGSLRMGIYEEQAEVCRRIIPYQNVTVRKESMEDTVSIQQVVRREELDVNAMPSSLEIEYRN